jgi:V-type H+-transporting ATPase subunit a
MKRFLVLAQTLSYFKLEGQDHQTVDKDKKAAQVVTGRELSWLVGLMWIPQNRLEEFNSKIDHIKAHGSTGAIIRPMDPEEVPELVPPTHFEETDWAAPGQTIIDLYGIPTYKEVNPAIFANITFPFLFGVMFGDIFSGTILLCAGMCFYTTTMKEAAPAAYQFRHFYLLMGIFSVYCGFLYNDYTAIPLYLFGESCYNFTPNAEQTSSTISARENCVYPFGLDPVWYASTDELTFTNSLKMKMAVILGVFQMCLGICMKGFNNLHFKNEGTLSFMFEFIPSILMMVALFGFMDYLIVMKWLTNWEGNTANAPSIITTMITMALGMGIPGPNDTQLPIIGGNTLEGDLCCNDPCISSNECGSNLFCSPLQHVCVERITSMVHGPNCTACKEPTEIGIKVLWATQT